MPTVSVGPANVGTSVATAAELTATVTNSLQEGDLAYVKVDGSYWKLLPLSTAPASAAVIYTDTAQGGLAPGRWVFVSFGGGGGGPVVANRRDHSVNGAMVEFYRSAATPLGGPLMRMQTNRNVVGGYTGGGLGNKAILGHFLPAPGFMLLSDLVSVEYTSEKLTPEAVGVNLIPFGNLMVDLTPGSPIPLIVVMVFGDVGNAVPTGIFTTPAPNQTKVVWMPQTAGPTAGGNLALVVNFEGMSGPPAAGLWPVIVPKSFGPPGDPTGLGGGSAWPGSGYRFADILAVYPLARIVNVDPLDGGLPAATIMSGITLNTGSSANFVQNVAEILDWKVNGVAV